MRVEIESAFHATHAVLLPKAGVVSHRAMRRAKARCCGSHRSVGRGDCHCPITIRSIAGVPAEEVGRWLFIQTDDRRWELVDIGGAPRKRRGLS